MVVDPRGLEPPTSQVTSRVLCRLSYGPADGRRLSERDGSTAAQDTRP